MALRSILPPNSTPQERAIEAAGFRLTNPPEIADACNPVRIPAALLPWLAWGWSVDAWNPGETEEVKRHSILKSSELHRLKGTVEGFRRLSALFGAELAGVERPPNKMFAGRSYTQAEKDARLAVLPQLRIRTRPVEGRKVPGSFWVGDFLPVATTWQSASGPWEDQVGPWDRADMQGPTWKNAERPWSDARGPWDDTAPSVKRIARFLVRSNAAERLMPQAYYYDRGIETKVATFQEDVSSSGFVQIRQSAVRKYATFCGGTLRFLLNCRAGERIYSFRPTYERGPESRYKTLVPGLQPLEVCPEYTAETSQKHGLFAGPPHAGPYRAESFLGQFLVRSTAARRLYGRIYLFDPTRTLESKGKTTFMGAARLGMPAYTAELQVLFPRRRSRHAFGRFLRGFLIRTDQELLDKYITALAWGKAVRDQVFLDTRAYEPITAGPQHIAGTGLVAGQMVRRF